MDLALNNLQRSICHKTKKAKQTQPSIHRYMNNSPDIQVLMNVVKTGTFNVGFTSQ